MHRLEQTIGYTFHDRSLLERALTHSSYANEVCRDGLKSYERLEFLGDSILGFLTADRLYQLFPELHEGELTKLRAELVCESSLAAAAAEMRLGAYLLLGRGEETCGGRSRPSILADAVESILAAIYLDGGFDAAKRYVYRFVLTDTKARIEMNADYKTKLQELVQRQRDRSLEYVLLSESGPDHDKRFCVVVTLDGTAVGQGEGTSKKRAEQAAAKAALAQLFPGEAGHKETLEDQSWQPTTD